ncbi:MAG: sigma-70 family RNA polymerase sigma factor [Bacilli bacterium]|nr:sigma-70 family RNA polymerase sigma factor [Bacilli bacterium]
MGKIDYGTLKRLCSTSKEEVDAAFDVIFQKYARLVRYVAYDVLKDEEEAKDIVNETFLKMYEKRRTFMKESGLKYYLLVTAKNLSINRSKQRTDHLEYSDDLEGAKEGQSVSLYLEQFKETLDEEEYRYLVLHLLYDFTFREIAKANGVTTSTVSSKYRRGIQKLREHYGGER